MRRIGFVAVFCVLAAACGDSGTDNQGGFEQAFEDNFNKSFHESFVASCIRSSTAQGVAEELATNLCTCASDKVKERFTASEKMSLKDEQIDPIVKECTDRFVN